MKKVYFLFCVLFIKNIISQEILKDHWLGVQTFSTVSSLHDYNVSTIVDNKIVMVIDTLSSGMSNRSGLFTYDINTRSIGNINFSLEGGDRGIKCATSYKTGTPGLEYGIFGCYALADAGESFPVIYTYNSQTGSITSDSLQEGNTSIYDGGIQKIIMYSPSTNNDTMRVFSRYNFGLSVFSKQINQTTFSPLSSVPVNIDFVNACYIFNNILYIGGMYLDQPCLLESTDGRTFTPVSGFNGGSFPQYSCINNITSYNNQLYYSINMSGNDFYIYRYNSPNHFLVQSSGGFESVKSMSVYKNRLFVSTAKNAMSYLSYIYVLDGPGNVDTSASQFGYQDVDANLLELITNGDSLYFIGNKGTFQASKAPGQGSANVMQLLNKYSSIAKLNAPISAFNYNNNQICLNANETFTSTSQNADSLRWIFDNNYYYAASPGGSAWMNYDFGSTGSHTVGLIAFGGTLSDTSFLSVNVYSVSASIVATRTLVCYNSSVSGSSEFTQTTSGTLGTVTYQWQRDFPVTTVGTGNSYTYTPSSFGTTYSFWLIATDGHGCSAISNTISVGSNPLYDIDGTLYTGSSPTITSVQGNVVLYKYQPTLGMFDSLTYLTTTSWGYFDFSGIDDGDFILKAIPSASSLQISYYGNDAVMWKDAVPFTHTCANPTTNTVNVIPLTNLGGGPGQLQGTISQASGFGNKSFGELKPMFPGQPIGGIIVKGGRNPGGQMFTQTTTDPVYGTYTLTGLPVSTDDYFVMVDIPGLDTNGTYHRKITVSTTTITGLDFTVDSIYVNPIGFATNVNSDNSILNNSVNLYPNPTSHNTTLHFELTENTKLKADLYDLVGRHIEVIIPDSEYTKNSYKYSINTEQLNSGIYFVKLKINNTENVIKLIITN